MPTEKPRFSVTFTDDTFTQIQQYKIEHKISTQSKAVAQLVELAIKDLERDGVIEKAPSLSDEAQKIATRYSKLDRYGKATVQAVLGEEEARVKEQAEMDEFLPKPEPKIIPLYWTPAAAGYASPALGADYDNYTLTPEDPQGAVFAIKVQGDSMEPYFPDGSVAFCNHDPIADGDVGVFCLDGENFIKQYHYDRIMGMTYLFSLNRDRADADKLITRTSGQTLTCFGRVITRRRYPLPR